MKCFGLLIFIVGLSPLFLAFQKASANGNLKFSSLLIDSEAARIWYFSPSAEVSFAVPQKAGWSANTQFRLPFVRSDDPQVQLGIRIKEASLFYRWDVSAVSAGRILLRTEASTHNESLKSYMQSEPTVDGLRFASENDSMRWSVFAGGPLVLGGTVGFDVENAKFSIVYRGERYKLFYYPMVTNDGLIVQSPKASHAHEVDVSFKVTLQDVLLESAFQMLNHDVLRDVTLHDATWGNITVGKNDDVLPSSTSEYRVAVQGKHLIDESEQNKNWLFLSWASRTSSRIHDGTLDEKRFRQGGGSDSQLTMAWESSYPTHAVQCGTTFEYSANPRYFFLADRTSSGEPRFVKGKAQIWMSTRIQF